MGRRNRKRRRIKGRKRRGQPTADLDQPPPDHPLGTWGLDWDDDYASIAGFTSGGAPYGVPWAEATWLLDDPEFAEDVLLAQEEAAFWAPLHPERYDDVLGPSPADRARGDPIDDIPF